ncbi:Zinc/iron permease [Rozella allomycis CSF55]|uniref:Zinc/iron permease n=1 Tax=Rozella allomycis (strain CSF55) TaxID=988480 RepID=A0A4P9YFC4_ROZAC|nr:Zinc/iron permease [Rozella allomycis CSF55]
MSVGTLLSDSFLHLIKSETAIGALMGIYVFFLLERLLQQFHRGHGHSHVISSLLILADGLHNLMDGLAIGVSFVSSKAVGISSSVAILCHEIPRELSDYTILLSAGLSTFKVFKISLLFCAVSYVGGLVGYYMLVYVNEDWMNQVLAFVGGNFIYIALADLLPELQRLGGKDTANSHFHRHEYHQQSDVEDHSFHSVSETVNADQISTTNLHAGHNLKQKVIPFLVRHAGLWTGFAIMILIKIYEI